MVTGIWNGLKLISNVLVLWNITVSSLKDPHPKILRKIVRSQWNQCENVGFEIRVKSVGNTLKVVGGACRNGVVATKWGRWRYKVVTYWCQKSCFCHVFIHHSIITPIPHWPQPLVYRCPSCWKSCIWVVWSFRKLTIMQFGGQGQGYWKWQVSVNGNNHVVLELILVVVFHIWKPWGAIVMPVCLTGRCAFGWQDDGKVLVLCQEWESREGGSSPGKARQHWGPGRPQKGPRWVAIPRSSELWSAKLPNGTKGVYN